MQDQPGINGDVTGLWPLPMLRTAEEAELRYHSATSLLWHPDAWYTLLQEISMSLTVEEIIAAAAQLPEDDRLRLVQALSAGGTGSGSSITELRGLGKEIWCSQDAQEYVDQERDSWTG